jgi:hypothetical protein
MIDYRVLLRKYMELIIQEEGADYLGRMDDYSNRVPFSQEERRELLTISDEILPEEGT